MRMYGISLGWGKRLRWPDDYFVLSAQLAYQRYQLKNWKYFLMNNGAANNLNLSISLSRTSTDNPLFPRRGSEFTASVTLTPPWSVWNHRIPQVEVQGQDLYGIKRWSEVLRADDTH